jgi:CPA1 family monovalent cation:H+ antiporter
MPPPPFSWRENLVIAWTGMRGVVTLAAAAGIPLLTASGEPFPGREAIQAIAFVVTIGTLLIQGLTLPWLIKTLAISDPDEGPRREKQLHLAEQLRHDATVTVVHAFAEQQTTEEGKKIAQEMLARVDSQSKDVQSTITASHSQAIVTLVSDIQAARRAALIKARDDLQLDDEVMREVLEQIDLEQAVTANWPPGRFGGAG